VEEKDCADLCRGDPFVEIIQNGVSRATYERVKPSDAPRIVDEHIVNGKVVRDLILASAD
jgi:NADP-reducing hydrogenase subunit HndB